MDGRPQSSGFAFLGLSWVDPANLPVAHPSRLTNAQHATVAHDGKALDGRQGRLQCSLVGSPSARPRNGRERSQAPSARDVVRDARALLRNRDPSISPARSSRDTSEDSSGPTGSPGRKGIVFGVLRARTCASTFAQTCSQTFPYTRHRRRRRRRRRPRRCAHLLCVRACGACCACYTSSVCVDVCTCACVHPQVLFGGGQNIY